MCDLKLTLSSSAAATTATATATGATRTVAQLRALWELPTTPKLHDAPTPRISVHSETESDTDADTTTANDTDGDSDCDSDSHSDSHSVSTDGIAVLTSAAAAFGRDHAHAASLPDFDVAAVLFLAAIINWLALLVLGVLPLVVLAILRLLRAAATATMDVIGFMKWLALLVLGVLPLVVLAILRLLRAAATATMDVIGFMKWLALLVLGVLPLVVLAILRLLRVAVITTTIATADVTATDATLSAGVFLAATSDGFKASSGFDGCDHTIRFTENYDDETPKICILLFSSMCGNVYQRAEVNRVRDLLDDMDLLFVEMDVATTIDMHDKLMQQQLREVSGKRAFPQVFTVDVEVEGENKPLASRIRYISEAQLKLAERCLNVSVVDIARRSMLGVSVHRLFAGVSKRKAPNAFAEEVLALPSGVLTLYPTRIALFKQWKAPVDETDETDAEAAVPEPRAV